MYSKTTGDLASTFLLYRNNIKMYHWSTLSYPRHKASCGLLEKVDDLTDTIIETYSARYGRPQVKENTSLLIVNMSDKAALESLQDFSNWLRTDFPKFVDPKKDTDLLNTRDSLLGELQQAIYLYQLK